MSSRRGELMGMASESPGKTLSKVSQLLLKLKLAQHEENFRMHSITNYSDLQMLTDEQMREIGIWKVGERNRLKRWITKNLRDLSVVDSAMSSSIIPLHYRDGPPVEVQTDRRMSGGNTVAVTGCGLMELNGTYAEKGNWDGVKKYYKSGIYKGEEVDFSLFRCRLIDDNRVWFISIVPEDQDPGTNLDIDFYSSPTVQDLADTPPEGGWIICSSGVAPPPSLLCDLEYSVSEYQPAREMMIPEEEEESFSNGKHGSLPTSLDKNSRSEFDAITIQHSGSGAINGLYTLVGKYNGAPSYQKRIFFEDKWQVLCLFKCPIQDNQNRWYISRIPEDSDPGTELDVDYYSAPEMKELPNRPPRKRWVLADEGLTPPPRLWYGSQEIPQLQDEELSLTASTTSMGTMENDSATSISSAEVFNQGKHLCVQGAALSIVNGIYSPAGTHGGVTKYQRHSFYKNKDCIISLFRCLVKGNKYYWYISIVPPGSLPGTIRDTDFYTAPANDETSNSFPPEDGWITVGEGEGCPPTVKIHVFNTNSQTFETINEEEYKDIANVTIADDGKNAIKLALQKVSLSRNSTGVFTTKASEIGDNINSSELNPLGVLVDENAKRKLSESGINVETINTPHLVTLNGERYNTTRETNNTDIFISWMD